MNPILTVCIPTYNRLDYLKELLEKLLPQLTDKVEVLVSDNCSSDGTWDYLLSLHNIKKNRHETNIGADRNVQSLIKMPDTQYIWLLCDDDLPSANAIANIFEAIESHQNPPLIYLRTYPMGKNSEGYNPCISTDWEVVEFEKFLTKIGIWFTFASSIVARKDCMDLDFAEKWIDKSLSSAAIALRAALYGKKVVLSEKPILAARGGNSGGYNGITVFTKYVSLLLDEFSSFVSKGTIDQITEESLLLVSSVLSHDRSFTTSSYSFLHLIQYGWRYKVFYTSVIPSFVFGTSFSSKTSKLKGIFTNIPKKLVKKIIKQALISIEYDECTRIKNSLAYCGENSSLGADIDVIGSNFIRIGKNFSCSRNIRLHCWKDASTKEPSLTIGENVFINSMSYISCANQIDIADNVLIGSNVFIADNCHGDTSKVVQSRLDAPIISKGPIKIGPGVWIGNNVCILPNVSIGENSIIGANSVVTKDVPPGHVVGGVPATLLRKIS